MSDPGKAKGSEPVLIPDASGNLDHTEDFDLADPITPCPVAQDELNQVLPPQNNFCFRVNGITLDIYARVPQTSLQDVSIPQHGVLLQNPGHHIADQLPHSQESSFLAAASPPNHQCRQLCHLLGCFATAPWTQQVQNVQHGQSCAPELQVLFSESSSGLRRVLFAASVAFEGEDRGRCGFLNFKQFLGTLQSLCVDMPYHHRLSLFMNSDADQDGWITRNEFSTAYLRILLFSSNSCR